MGFVKKTVKSATKAVKKVAKTVTKVVKKVAKPVVNIVKKVAKTVVSVGKKVVSGIKSAVKSVGKVFTKLGPLASMALMAIPGLQPFAAGMWGSMGIQNAVLQKALTSAAVSFVTSGGNLKAAVVGGVMGGAGAAIGGTISGVSDGMSVGDAFSKTISQQGVANFASGQALASQQWGNFTNNVENFFSSNSTTGSVADGAAATTSTFEKYGMSPTEYMETYGKVPDTAIGMTPESADLVKQMTPEQITAKVASGDMTQQAQMLAEQNADFLASDPVAAGQNFGEMMYQTTPTEIGSLYDANHPMFNAPAADQAAFKASMTDMGIDVNSQQAKMLAEQQFADTVNMTKTDLGEWNYNTFNTQDPTLVMNTPQEYNLLTQSGAGGTPTYMAAPEQKTDWGDKAKDALKSLLDPGAAGGSGSGFVATGDPGKGIGAIAAAGGVGGSGGMLGFTQQQRELQSQLIAQAEAQAEAARKRAASGWGVA